MREREREAEDRDKERHAEDREIEKHSERERERGRKMAKLT